MNERLPGDLSFYSFRITQFYNLKDFIPVVKSVCLMTILVMILWPITLVRKTMADFNIVVSHILKNIFLINYFEYVNLFN